MKAADDELSRVFHALADPTRRAILSRLHAGPATVGALAEPFAMSRPAISQHLNVLERAGREILRRTRMQAVLITRGSRGMALFAPRTPTLHIPIFGTDSIVDVTGAGDTVVSAVTLALAAGASFEQAARLANFAGGLVVMKRGTATVAADELRAVVHG